MLCLQQDTIQVILLGCSAGGKRSGPPQGQAIQGYMAWEGDLKTVIQSAKKPVCFLLSEWQAVLNNVNNKLSTLTKKNIFVGLGSK